MSVDRGIDVLVSGASVAGPTLAYWLHRYGLRVTVVERTAELRAGWGGHAVDLFGPSVEVAERMGILPRVLDARTRTEVISFLRPGHSPVDVDMSRLVAGVSSRHVEILRGELAGILHDATRHDVEYVFGDSIRALHVDGDGIEVAFERGGARRFDLVVGADGLHSQVRRLCFGAEETYRSYIGGYFAVFSVPNHLGLEGRMLTWTTPGRVAAVYPVRQTGQARAGFLLRRDEELRYDHRDVREQQRLLREAFADDGWEVPRLLAEMDRAPDFYFDSISQIRMATWSRGRVTLVGDAGYCPGAAVGGGTSLALTGAYVLAGELAAAGRDLERGLRGYEAAMGEAVRRSRSIGPATMRTLIPRTRRDVWLTMHLLRLVPRLPVAGQRALFSLQGGPARALDAIDLSTYVPPA